MEATSDLPSEQPEYPPLLPVGRHVMSLGDLHLLCVTDFPLSSTRSKIMGGLEQVVQRLAGAGVAGEIWVNGSFLTKKVDPRDVDIVLRVQAEVYESGSGVQRTTIDWFDEDLKSDYLCDSFVLLEWPEGHPNYWAGEAMYAYWMRQWTFSRGGEMKGIAVIELSGSTP